MSAESQKLVFMMVRRVVKTVEVAAQSLLQDPGEARKTYRRSCRHCSEMLACRRWGSGGSSTRDE